MDTSIYFLCTTIMIAAMAWMFYLIFSQRKSLKTAEIKKLYDQINDLEKKLHLWEEAGWEIVENIKKETEVALTELKKREMEVKDMQEKAAGTPSFQWKMTQGNPLENPSLSAESMRAATEETKREKVIKLHEKGYKMQEITRKLQMNRGEVQVILNLQEIKKRK